jgi:DNA-binding transcriptional LysR family regulator
MDLRQLEHFVAVAEERHFSRAAQRVHIVQSGLSTSVRTLERELGTTLFLRTTRSVELTESGRALLPEARATLDAARRAREAVSEVEGMLTGRLVVGIMQVLGPVDLPRVLARFRARHPGIELSLRQQGSLELLESVRDGRVDVALVGIQREEIRGVHAELLATAPLTLACPREHPLARRRRLAVTDLADEDFVEFPPDWGVRRATDQAFAAAGVPRRIAFELNDMGTVLDLVARGLGVAICPPWVAAGRRPIVWRPLSGEALRWEIHLVTRAAEPDGAAARAFVDLVRERRSLRG